MILRKLAVFCFLVCAVAFNGIAAAKVYTVKQKDKRFVMKDRKIATLVIQQGDEIRFENADPFFHNIYSLSNLKTFDLGSYRKGESKSVVFNKRGRVEVECAIHPRMYLEVKVQ